MSLLRQIIRSSTSSLSRFDSSLSCSKIMTRLKPQLILSSHLTKFPMSTTAVHSSGGKSLCRQNYHEECESAINKQINAEFNTSYTYLSMAYYFDREDIALPGFHEFFKKNSLEEYEHATELMKYQNKRGGRIILQPISKPVKDEWDGPLEAITMALELEKSVNQMLLDLHTCASRHGDAHLTDYIEEHFLEEQVRAIKELADHISNLKRVGKGLGEYVFDKEFKK